MPGWRLHYIYDPLCGWCYAAEPLVHAARALPGLAIEMHAGGMLRAKHRQAATPAWRQHVLASDRRIAELTGQPFGHAYTEGLLRDPTVVLDSEPPSTAILAAQELGGRGLDLLARIQRAYYVEGLRVSERTVLDTLAIAIGLEGDAFAAAYARWSGTPTHRHFTTTRQWLARVGGQGFPTFALEAPPAASHGETRVSVAIDIGRYHGRTAAWVAELMKRMETG